jgi:hypothetical protein
MAAVTTLRRVPAAAPPPPPMTERRAKLAEAIERLHKAEGELAALEAACGWDGSARQAEAHARDALEKAEAALDTAKRLAVDRLVRSATNTAGEAPVSIRDARHAVQAAHEDADAAVAAREALQGRLDAAKPAVEAARRAVEAGASAVLFYESAEAIGALVAEIEETQRNLVDRTLALQLLAQQSVILMSGPCALPGVSTMLNRFTTPPTTWQIVSKEASATRQLWEAARLALHRDALAPLPRVPQ